MSPGQINLRDDAKADFDRNGFLVVRALCDSKAVRALQTATETLEAEADQWSFQPGRRTFRNNATALTGTSTPTYRLLSRELPIFRAHAHRPDVAKVAAVLLGVPVIRLITDQLIIKQSGGGSGQIHWHQDASYWSFSDDNQVSCWLALDKIDQRSGGIAYVVGSHHLGRFDRVELGTGIARRGAQTVPSDPAEEGHQVVRPLLAAGDAVFHHSLTWHGSAPNFGARPRRALVTRYLGGEPSSDSVAAYFPVLWPP